MISIPMAVPQQDQYEAILAAIATVASGVAPVAPDLTPLTGGTNGWVSIWTGEMPHEKEIASVVEQGQGHAAYPVLVVRDATESGYQILAQSVSGEAGSGGPTDEPRYRFPLYGLYEGDPNNSVKGRAQARRTMLALRAAFRSNYTLNRACDSCWPENWKPDWMLLDGAKYLAVAYMEIVTSQLLRRDPA